MSSWKKYGGIDKFDQTNNITADSIAINYFTVRKQIVGDIDISGNLAVRTRFNVFEDSSFNSNVTIQGRLDILDNLDVCGNIITQSNLIVNDNMFVYNNLYFNSDEKVFITGTTDGTIGVNTETPISQFDIISDLKSVFSVKTSQSSTENVIARNNLDKGIVVKSDLSSATIDFFCDSSMISSVNEYIDSSGFSHLDVQTNYDSYDARIQSNNDGSLILDSKTNIQLLAKTIITDNNLTIVDDNTTLSVYNDKTNNIYLNDVYDNNTAYLGDGISVVAVDSSSTIFMKMISRSYDSVSTNKGFALAGGAYPKDTSRAMGSIGCLDTDGNYTPNQTIVSGNSTVKLKTSVGINKYVPSVDEIVVDINGPVRINNGEITTVKNADFQCNFLSFFRDNVNIGISAGVPHTVFDSSQIDQTYWESYIFYTNDGGIIWNTATARVTGSTSALQLNAGFVYDSSFAFIYGDDGAGFYTNDGGSTWLVKSFDGTDSDIKSLYVAKGIGQADGRFFMTYASSVRYYDAKIDSVDSQYVSYEGSNGSISLENSGEYTINTISFAGVINAVHGYESHVYFAGAEIYKYDAASTITASNYINVHNSNYTYNTIYACDASYIVAAGINIISYSFNGGADWNDIIFSASDGNGVDLIYGEETFNSIHIYDLYNAIAVGINGAIYYTTNGSLWKKVPDNLLDAAGNRTACYGSDAKLNSVFCVSKNSFVTSRIVNDYTDIDYLGSSKIFYNFFPNLLNRSENTVLDLCGNMNIFGDIHLQDNGNITSSGTTFYLVNDSVQNIYFGSEASSIEIGDNSGSTTIHHSLYVDKDLTVDGNIYLPNTAFIGTADISGLYVYQDAAIDGTLTVGTRVNIENNASITSDDTSGAPLYVAGGSHFEGNVIMSDSESSLYVKGTTELVGELYVMNNIYIDSTNTSSDYAVKVNSGNVFVNNNMDISGNLEVKENLLSLGNTFLSGSTYISGNLIYNSPVITYSNVTISDDYTYNPSIINCVIEGWDSLDEPVSLATREYVDGSLNSKAPLASPLFTGSPSAPTANVDVSSTQIATTAFVKNQYYLSTTIAASTYAPISSPVFTGIPTAPTAATTIDTDQVATTSFVKNVINNISDSIRVTSTENTWSATNTFTKDLYINGAQFGTIDGSSILIGSNSLSSLTTGINNIAMGSYNGYNITTGLNNIAMGSYNGYNITTGLNNIAMGSYNGYNITTGSNNSIIGYQSLYSNNTGGNNVAIGNSALYNNTDGSYNIAIGYNAGYSDTNGSYNIYVGGNTNTTGNYARSTAIGYGATISGNNQIVLGSTSEYLYIPSTTTSTSTTKGALVINGGAGIAGNVNVGRSVNISGNDQAYSTKSGSLVILGGAGISGNVYIGGIIDISGNAYASTASSSENSKMLATTAFVKNALTTLIASDQTWSGNNYFSENISANGMIIGNYGNVNYSLGTIFGENLTGTYNIGAGSDVLSKITSGSYNIGIGNNVLENIDAGSNNIGVGSFAISAAGDNVDNTAIGYYALNQIKGDNNTAIGSYAGNTMIKGYFNTFIGSNTSTSFPEYSYSTAIGQSATITGNNQVVLGTSGEYVYIPGTIISDSSLNGALVVSGGVGIGGNLYVGSNFYVGGNIIATTATTGTSTTQVATTAFVQNAINSTTNTTGNNTWTGTNAFSNNITANGVVIGSYGTTNYSVGTTFGNISTGSYNIGLGSGGMSKITTGSYNIGLGNSSLYNDVSGSYNTAIGGDALYNVTTGSYNTAVGSLSGNSNTTGTYNSFLGYNSTASSGTFNYSTAIGQNASITASNQVVLGTSGEYVYIPGTKISDSASNGALVVTGGVGIGGNLYVGGNLYATTATTGTSSTIVATTAYVQTAISGISSSVTTSTNTWYQTNTFTKVLSISDTTVSTGSTSGALVVSGGVGIAKSLYVAGGTASTSSTTGTLVVTGGAGISGNIYVGTGGNVYVTSTTASISSTSGALVVTGGIGVTGAIYSGNSCTASSFNATSDYRIKHNVTPLTGDFTVNNLNPVQYYNILTDSSDIGFIAHEVQQEYPYLVRGEKDGKDYQSLNYTGLIGVLVHEIKELKKENLTMKEELQTIKNLLQGLT